ncbi:MAG: hypothetical protein EBV64_15130, partial [Oxalobacteraceae bacterium]|nr:hypothetical protein [Oxalobacteraceae bacterium]
GGSANFPCGRGSFEFVRHFCSVPLIFLTATGKGLRPAIRDPKKVFHFARTKNWAGARIAATQA